MRSLPQQHSELYDKIMTDRFIVRQGQGVFNAGIPWNEAAANHPLVTDKCWDITSRTWQVSQESKWQMVYHEIITLSNWLREFTSLNLSNRESNLRHQLYGKYAKLFNGNLMEYFWNLIIINILQNITPNYTISLQKFSSSLKLLSVIYTFIIMVEITTNYSGMRGS